MFGHGLAFQVLSGLTQSTTSTSHIWTHTTPHSYTHYYTVFASVCEIENVNMGAGEMVPCLDRSCLKYPESMSIIWDI